jgi:Phage Mu protein F like protein
MLMHERLKQSIKLLELGLKNQLLMSKCADLGMFSTLKKLNQLDALLWESFLKIKQTDDLYIWRTSEDEKVRPSHAANNGKIFSRSSPPPTGNPEDDFNCRCTDEEYTETYDIDKIEPVYPELFFAPFLKLGNVFTRAVDAIKYTLGRGNIPKNDRFTSHGAIRSTQRKITMKEAEKAIETAKKSGDVTTKIGRYGTPQNIYRGSNGVTVVVETAGRNAGKIITHWRH